MRIGGYRCKSAMMDVGVDTHTNEALQYLMRTEALMRMNPSMRQRVESESEKNHKELRGCPRTIVVGIQIR